MGQVVDLSYGISGEMSKYPSDPKPMVKTLPAKEEEGKVFSSATNLIIRPHHGTHIDAPAHKIPGGKTIDRYTADKFVNKAILIDLTDCGGDDYLREVNKEILEKILFKDYLKELQGKDITALLFRTGYDKKIEQGTFNDYNFPCLTEQAADYIANSGLSLNLIGLDSFSVDKKGSNSESHRIFLSRNILILETIVNLCSLRQAAGNNSFILHSAPIKYYGADGAQTRAYAIIH